MGPYNYNQSGFKYDFFHNLNHKESKNAGIWYQLKLCTSYVLLVLQYLQQLLYL